MFGKLETLAFILSGILFLLGSSVLAQDPTPDNRRAESGAPVYPSDVPRNYDFQTGHGTTGSVLSTEKSGRGSATQTLLRAFRDVSQFFAGQPTPLTGIRDQQDQSAQILFQTAREGQAVRGLALAVCNTETRQIQIHFLFDQEARFPTSLPRLMQFIQPQSSQSISASLNWRWTQLPDGSGKIKLPDGWQITESNRGMVVAQGPHGKILLGFWVPVRTPDDFMVQMTNQYPIVAPFSDPVTAYKNIAPQYIRSQSLSQGQTPPEASFRVIESSPIQYEGNMQTAFILADEYYAYSNGQTTKNRILLRATVGRTDPTQWIFYFSVAGSPPETFVQNLPILREIWQSWKTDDRIFQQRMDQAIRDMNEASRVFQEGMQAQSQAMDRALDNWSEHMREYQYMRDTESNQLYQVNLHQSENLVDELNREAGYPRYEVIPLREFNRY